MPLPCGLSLPSAMLRSRHTQSGDVEPMPEQTWIITTAVGTGEKGYAGDGGPAERALLNGPFDVGYDVSGTPYFADTLNHGIRLDQIENVVNTTCAGYSE